VIPSRYGPVADPLRPYLVTFRHALVDLARIDDSALSQHLRVRAFLKALKYILRGDLLEHLESLLVDARRASLMDLELVAFYIWI
jgi:Putative transposase, YhgA-like